ncbi:hypothetical protein FNV43_RR25318 [Rhamnella rubrinervis]|uniref:Uncharacterized protein n=1 Tax=Rhamnella rubrinervis TaxID=2594499 RepID=A0A8K0GU16_9ROSA|nr:hypothetical protein FNV43_RR25318 [Rhamnella rubrinervis]
MSSAKLQLFAAIVIMLIFHSNGDPPETDLCNFEDDGFSCHFSGECKTTEDCRSACAALGLNPDAVKCVAKPKPKPKPNPAAAAAAGDDDGKHCCCFI